MSDAGEKMGIGQGATALRPEKREVGNADDSWQIS